MGPSNSSTALWLSFLTPLLISSSSACCLYGLDLTSGHAPGWNVASSGLISGTEEISGVARASGGGRTSVVARMSDSGRASRAGKMFDVRRTSGAGTMSGATTFGEVMTSGTGRPSCAGTESAPSGGGGAPTSGDELSTLALLTARDRRCRRTGGEDSELVVDDAGDAERDVDETEIAGWGTAGGRAVGNGTTASGVTIGAAGVGAGICAGFHPTGALSWNLCNHPVR